MIFLKNRRSLYSINVNLLDQSMEFRGKLEVDQMYDICQCEGLIICETNTGLVVWNPCTGETTRIKPRRYKSSDIFALGYENSCHSYKILKLSCLRKIKKEFYTDVFEIYEHSSDSWRDLDVKTHKCCILSRGVSLKGKAYWIASDKEAPSDEFILSFDFKTERFRRLSVPYQSDNHGARVVLSGFREQQLSVLRQNVHVFLFEIEIWVADNNIDEANEVLWNKYLVVDHVKFSIGGLRWVTSFLLDQENKVAVCCSTDLMINGEWKTKIHIVGEDMHKQVYEEIKEGSDQLLLLSYVPSLVHVHKNNP